MMNNRVAYLVSKKLSGEITEMEISELNDALLANPALFPLIQVLENVWHQKKISRDDLPAEAARLLQKLKESEKTEPAGGGRLVSLSGQIFSMGRFAGYAAALVLLLIGLWWMIAPAGENESAAPVPVNEVATQAGSKTQIVLRDGTRVWLNADSKLSYANLFQGKTREVRLSGEAYFEVVSNPERPFIIHGEKITIKVTGTSFNVRDYPGEQKAETSLISGKVEVSSLKNPEKIYHLKPSEKIVFKEKDLQEPVAGERKPRSMAGLVTAPVMVQIMPLQLDPVERVPVETAWVNNQLAFSNESFREVADKMEKWYNVDISFDAPSLEQLRFSGRFETETLTEALEALQYSTPFRYELKDNKITIYKN